MVELINATGEDLSPTTSYVFCVPDDRHCDVAEWVQPGFILERNSQEIIESIQVSVNGAR